MIFKHTFIILSACFFVTNLFAGERTLKNLNKDWEYLEKPYYELTKANESNAWVQVDLPHSWNDEDAVDQSPGYRRDASWYRKIIDIESIDIDSDYFLYFEGVNIKSKVYVNGALAGGHIGGYIGFEIPLTKYLKNGKNTIMVRVDNGYDRNVIPSQKSDFFIYGGITRDVWLKKVSKTHISKFKVITPEVSKRLGKTNFSIDLTGSLSAKHMLNVKVAAPSGKIVFNKTIKAQRSNKISFNIKSPDLWHVKNPNLYKATVKLLDQNKSEIDDINENYGYRWFEFKDHGPFFLNGERLLLRGTHRHEEHAGVGAAMTNKMHRRDMELIKSMGANFVRLGHYPQDPEIYKAADELGLLIWDELPWCRGGIGGDQWKGHTKRMLKEIITQNFNHPSIIIWSLGNEIYWLPDFEGGDDSEKMNEFLTELNDIAHREDPYRKTAIRKYYAGADIVDVFSPSIWSGWYSGTYKNYEKAIVNSQKKYKHFIHMEYGGSSHVGRHTEQPITGDGIVNPDDWEEAINQVEVANVAQSGDWSENYVVDLFDWHLRVSEKQDQFVGNAQWAFKDFGTPLRPENDIPYINQKGLADRAGNPKDSYYVFKSYWSDEPFIYIESHSWTERSGPKGKLRNVNIYSNLEKVELSVNGVSLGTKVRDENNFPACGLNWDVAFLEGNNELLAIGLDKEGNEVKDLLNIKYSYERAGAPAEIALTCKEMKNGNYLVSAIARDENGRRCLDYEERVYFQCLSGGTVIRNQGTPIGSESIRMANGKASIEVKADNYAEFLKMSVLNQDFKGTYLEVKM